MTPERATTQISACIVCRNEASKLELCLRSLAWVDEIIMLDLESEDDSAEIAAAHGAKVVRRPPVPIVEMVRNEVAALASHDWILMVDPDERVTPGAAAALRSAASSPDIDAVVIPFTNFDLGYPATHPSQRYEPHLRMYRRSRISWPSVPNKQPSVPDRATLHLPSDDEHVIIHDRSRTIAEVLDRSLRYAPLQAQAMREAGEVFTARAMARALWQEIDRKLLEPQAWRDGLPGLLRAGILVNFKFYVWAELWRQSGAERTAADDRFVRRVGRGLNVLRALSRVARRVFGSARSGPTSSSAAVGSVDERAS